jgi:heme exporter protein D
MGGYGLYVWGSYAVSLVVIVGEVVAVVRRRRALPKSHERRETIETRRSVLEAQ